ncbi:MAG: TonB family protein [Gemmatimonadota bacterium]
MRILSLDWDISYQRDLAAELEASGHQVDLLMRADEAIACDAARPFDLIIAEARLSEGNGLQFLRELKDARGGELPPVVFLSEVEQPELRDLCLREGAARFLLKQEGWPATTAEIYGVMAEIEPVAELPAPTATASRVDPRIFRGNLETIDIVDIIQLLNLGRKTGTLVLAAGPREGRMYFSEGEIVAVSCEQGRGREAFAELLTLQRGSFRFEAGDVDVERTIHQPTSTLLLDALRMHDEQGRGRGDERLHAGDGAANVEAGDGFDFEHGGPTAEAALEQPAETAGGWLYAGLEETERPPDPARPARTPAPVAEAASAPRSAGSVSAAAAEAPSGPPPSSVTAATLDLDLRPVGPGATLVRRRGRHSRLPLPARRTLAVVGIASVVLLGSGSVFLFSDVLSSGKDAAAEEADYRALMLEAADNQARIDSLEQLIRDLSLSAGSAASPAGDAAAQQISLIQQEIAKVSAARDAVRDAATRKQAEVARKPAAEDERRAEQKEEQKPSPSERPVDGAGEARLAAADAAPGSGDSRPATMRDSTPREPVTERGLRDVDSASVLRIADLGVAEDAAVEPRNATVPAAASADEASVPDLSLSAIRGGPQFVPVDSRATPRSPIRPSYPPALAERKIGGTVTLWVLVDASGAVLDVRVLRSSSYAELDKAALDALRRAAYNPARRNGVPVPAWVQQQISFKLD